MMHFATIFTALMLPFLGINPDFGFAGGGGSSSDSSSGGSSYSSSSSSGGGGSGDLGSMLIGFGVFMVLILLASLISKGATKKRASLNSSTPEEQFIRSEAAKIFESYQADWSAGNSANIAAYATPAYYEHASYMLEALHDLHRVNKVSELKINYIFLTKHVDASTTLPAKLRIEYDFGGLDEVIDTVSGKPLYRKKARNVRETWNYLYDGKSLKLSGISQPTESAAHLLGSLAHFAAANHLYYSPDWGRYALPARGLIFGGASMEVADINNHIIGKWGDLLIQLYTYARAPGNPSSYYLVGQINVPKDYLGVIVKSKKYKARLKPPRDYDKFELEWPDFNKRYEVYAASRDALPAFELLNPTFMEFLYDKELDYNLEVADNVIYIFAPVRIVDEQNYSELLEILRRAHQELKM